MKKLSIIVPVCNSKTTLTLCLESLIAQELKNYEIIIINDGSTDGSANIIKHYSSTNKNIKVINQKNHGYGYSLNQAIEIAQGEYIGIVESDDFINTKMYETLFKKSKNADIIKCSYMNFSGRTWKTSPERLFHNIKKIDSTGILLNPKKNENLFLLDPTVWSAVYKRELLIKNDIKFLETPGASFQDAGFQFKAFLCAKDIFCLEQPLYYYRTDNPFSSTNLRKQLPDYNIFAVKTEYDSVDEFIKNRTSQKTNQNTTNLESFLELSAAARFKSYHWNLTRLKFKDALKFAKTAKQDYKKLKYSRKNPNGFNPNFYKKHKISMPHELKFSAKHPTVFVFLKPLFKFKNLILSTIFRLTHKNSS